MSSTAPVCGIVNTEPTSVPPTHRLPYIPIARDLPSLIQAVNQMRKYLQDTNKQQSGGNFKEVTRATKVERIYSPSDSSVYVDVEHINSLTMQDPITGRQWKWSR